ncbi:MAG: cation diffusion facilitator family transporter [Planctomycetota bacterium]
MISLTVGAVVMGGKFLAYDITGSTAVLSDALESIVNVTAAGFLLASILFAGMPADENHPYGHGKIEFFAAAFEGGLITFAAVITWIAAGRAMWNGPQVKEMDTGLVISAGAAIVNLVLGAYLIRAGKKYNSIAIKADGRHVLSDVWSTVWILVGLATVKFTQNPWFDPIFAILLGLQLAWTGYRLVREAAGGLLDEADETTVRGVLNILETARPAALIRLHHLRAMRFGARTHVDAHLVVPEYWSVEKAHNLCDAMELKLKNAFGGAVDVVFHADPCRKLYCEGCEVADCHIRTAPFAKRPALTLTEAVRPDIKQHN